ncbi:WxL domain-containing protein [Carnobacterium maltaromaticum]|uniref:WxL domain-containing protein n=1 Tax=Carnobacterium maltaromaticum TaxID=2751 RepID=A0AAW9JUK7_CARML|nr:WxL domain-containing protein [Carnobacterium maltaromaticum]MDZ5759243.1 WxL domain-containing protein [Carnobacterium maltaromaticum]
MKNTILFSTLAITLALGAATTMGTEAKAAGADGTATVKMLTGNTDPTDPVKPVDPEDPDNGGTDQTGNLTIDYVSNITFGDLLVGSSVVTAGAKNESPYVQVTDKRGTNDSWIVNASLSAFKSADQTDELKGASIIFTNPTVEKGALDNPSTAPTSKGTVELSSGDVASKEIFSSTGTSGKGTWLNVWNNSGEVGSNNNVQISVPGGQGKADVTYSATLKWELASVPSTK